jgi:site-specific recombinase XerD
MGMTNWDRAQRNLDRMLDPEAPPAPVPISEAIESYIEDCRARRLAESTVRSYQKTLHHFEAFCSRQAYNSLSAVTLETFTTLRASRRGRDGESMITSLTQRKEIECLRAFCAFACDRGWLKENFAKKLKPPRESEISTLPFSGPEVKRILDAAGKLDNNNVESELRGRQRARALILLLLYSGLRISDAAKLARASLDREARRLLLRIMKTGAPLHVKLPASVIAALDELPAGDFFFWNGKSKISTVTGNLRRTLVRVAKGTPDKEKNLERINVHPHRFRDTFAVSLLEQDVPIRTVQLLLGHKSVVTTEKHYAHFMKSQQRLLDDAVDKLDFSDV